MKKQTHPNPLTAFFPNAGKTLSNVGFLFGAGTALSAGYPLMTKLTIDVLNWLDGGDYQRLDTLVKKCTDEFIDPEKGNPNIEVISDYLESELVNANPKDVVHAELERIRVNIGSAIVKVMTEVRKPDVDLHVGFLRAFDRMLSGTAEDVWIFTTNYDPCWEIAAALAGVPLVDGFTGSLHSYFDVACLKMKTGRADGKLFLQVKKPVFRLIKLHGCLHWWRLVDGHTIRTLQPEQFGSDLERTLVLPRRQKVSETFEPPFGELFRMSHDVLGQECKFLISCGYSFSDDHINSTLLLPKLREKNIKLAALLQTDDGNLDELNSCPAFRIMHSLSATDVKGGGAAGVPIWKFEELVKHFSMYAGLEV